MKKKKKEQELSSVRIHKVLRYVLPDAGDLDGEVGDRADGPEGDEAPADPAVHDPVVRRHDHQQRQQRRQ